MAWFGRRTRWRSDVDPVAQPLDAALEARIAERLRATIPVTALPPVYACRTLLADTAAQLALVAVRDGVPRRPTPPVIARPDPSEPRWLTIHKLVMALSGDGNAWLLITSWDSYDRPASVLVLDPLEVQPDADEFGHLTYVRWRDRRLRVGDEVVHIPMTVDGTRGPLGVSPLRACRGALESIASLYGYAGAVWDEQGAPSVIIRVPQARLADGQADDLRNEWLRTHKGRRVPAVLWGGSEVQPFAEAPTGLGGDLDRAVAEVARAYGMPPSLVNAPSGDSLTYSTTEGELRHWLATGLGRYLTRIEAAFTDLMPRTTSARFDTSELLRADLAARVAAYSTALAGAAWLEVDEVRAREGLPPKGQAAPADDPADQPVTDPNLEGV
jgi:HK97 family phage portal protein